MRIFFLYLLIDSAKRHPTCVKSARAVIRHGGISRDGFGRADIPGKRTGTNNRDKQEDRNRPIPIKKQ